MSVPFDDTQNGLVGEYERPQALTSPASVIWPACADGSSVTRLVTTTRTCAFAPAAKASVRVAANKPVRTGEAGREACM